MDNKRLNQILNSPDTPSDLEAKLRANWKQQCDTENTRSRFRSLIAYAASVLVIFGLAISVRPSPAMVDFALDDIAAESRHAAGVTLSVNETLAALGINEPVKSMQVNVSKYCTLNRVNAVHLELAGEKQGRVHLFIQQGDSGPGLWEARSGNREGMSWKLIEPKEKLTVLVLRTDDMSAENVDKLIEHMFYS